MWHWLAVPAATTLYLAPMLVALGRGLPGIRHITAVNILFGWTVLGVTSTLVMLDGGGLQYGQKRTHGGRG